MQQQKKIRRLLTRDGKLDTVCKTTLNLHKGNIAGILTLEYDEFKALERRVFREPNYLIDRAKCMPMVDKLLNDLQKIQRV